MAEHRLRHLSEAAADGRAWQADVPARPDTQDERAAITQLEALSPLLRQIPQAQHRLTHITGGWLRLVVQLGLAMALVKSALALLGALLPGTWGPTQVPTPVFTLVVLTFGLMGVVLMAGSQWDERSRVLGWLFVFTASFFTNRQIGTLAAWLGRPWSAPLEAAAMLPVDALTPAAVWLFAARFPTAPVGSRVQRATRWLAAATALTGLFLVSANLAGRVFPAASWLAYFDRSSRTAVFPQLTFLTVPLMPLVMAAKGRAATPDERRRLGHFAAALLLGFSPIVLASLLMGPWSPVSAWFTPERIRPLSYVVYGGLLTIPFTTTWAVTRSGVFDVRFLGRAAVRSVLTRGALVALTLAPAALLLRRIYLDRHAPVADLLAATGARALLAWLVVAVASLALQPRLLRFVERRLLRTAPEVTEAAARVSGAARRARSVRELAEVMTGEVERTYHPEAIGLLVRQPQGDFQSPAGDLRHLGADTSLAFILAQEHGPVSLDPTAPADLFHLLPADEARWAADERVRHLLPIRTRDDRLVGVLLLGRRRGEVPFSLDDLRAIAATCEAAGVVLDGLLAQATSESTDAVECTECAAVMAESLSRACRFCGAAVAAAPIPAVVGHKYRVRARLGQGGMGTVYVADDERLRRSVALKALHRVELALLDTLLDEARLAARLDLPGLPRIHAVEDWRGIPILVMEYLPGGTLDARIAAGQLTPDMVARTTLALCETLSTLHAHGIAHRDIKPANVAFRSNDDACLLDLGLAGDARVRPWEHDQVGGTLSYIAPFVLAGSSDYARGDVWSLCRTMQAAAEALDPTAPRTGPLAAAFEAVMTRAAEGADAAMLLASLAQIVGSSEPGSPSGGRPSAA